MILSYSLISSILLAFGYIAYRLTMSGQSQHSLNRSCLIAIYASSLILPLLILPMIMNHLPDMSAAGVAATGNLTGGISAAAADHAAVNQDNDTLANIRSTLFCIYLVGSGATALYFLFGLTTLWRIIRRGEKTRYGTFTLILVDDSLKTGPFSWGRSIVMNRKDYEEFGDMILIHEHAHRSQRHWLDTLLAYFTICLQWYNPAAWATREELKAVHEYQADEMVMRSGVDRKEYQLLLLNKAAGYGYQSLANSLNHSKLKKRVTMMYKKKTSLRRRMFALALVPAIGAGIAVTAIPSVAGVLESLTDTEVSNPLPSSSSGQADAAPKRDIFVAVEDQAEFPGGMEGLMHWLYDNVKYPDAAEKAGVQGRVIIKFVIEADGTVTNPQIVRGVSPELDAEALRLVNAMPKWTPGKNNGTPVASYFTIPINFSIKEDKKEEAK